jgi:RNA polymerase sigma-70 factor (ECF subfamily)
MGSTRAIGGQCVGRGPSGDATDAVGDDARRVSAPHRAAEQSARASYGRLLAVLAARSRDIAASEDALANAFLAALRRWPVDGVPDNPDAWLLTAARNGLRNMLRHQGVVEASALDLALLQNEAADDAQTVPDDRLKLLFVCAHPAIEALVRTPLMLQTVLGLDASQIGAAFLVAPATMAQRLLRAKAKIKKAGLRFELPSTEDMPARLDDVLAAIYAAYGTSWDALPGADTGYLDLADEALFLSRLLVALLPNEPEARGLLALMLYCEARRPARRGPDGAFIPLKQQDARLWTSELIVEGENELSLAARSGVFGRYQCEAAIQSVHIQSPITGRTNHDALATLYGLLAARCPSVGVLVAQAAARVEAGAPEQALAVLNQLLPADVGSYQPYWVTLARATASLGDDEGAHAAMQRAIGLTEDPAIRAFLTQSAGR